MTTTLRRAPAVPARPQLWRITDRQSFVALQAATARVRRGALTVTWAPPSVTDGPQHPRVAFAVGRSAGGAVVRNRIRRRLRGALRELVGSGALPPGSYLIGARTEVATLPWSTLTSTLAAAVAAATEAGR